jgi:hypothetical protein
MKWTNQKSEPYQRTHPGYKGKKNGFEFNINDYTSGWGKKHVGWYVLVKCAKTDRRFNSLWIDLYWTDLEECKTWCENYTIDKLAEYWQAKELEALERKGK